MKLKSLFTIIIVLYIITLFIIQTICIKMIDFLKRKLEVGDSVIFITPGYRSFTLGRIDSFTKQKVRILTGELSWRGTPEILLQDPHQLVKVDGPELTMYLLKK